jgi:hypothetical protein
MSRASTSLAIPQRVGKNPVKPGDGSTPNEIGCW